MHEDKFLPGIAHKTFFRSKYFGSFLIHKYNVYVAASQWINWEKDFDDKPC